MADISLANREPGGREPFVKPISPEHSVKAEAVVGYAKKFNGAVIVEKGPTIDPKDAGERMSLFQNLLAASKWNGGTETWGYLTSESIRLGDPNSNEWYKLSINSLDPDPKIVDVMINKGLGISKDMKPVAIASFRGEYLDIGVEVDNSWHQESVTFKLPPGPELVPTAPTTVT